MQRYNATVSPLLLNVLDQLTVTETLSRNKVINAVADLSRLFTKDRASISRSYLEQPTLAVAYLSYFLPVNLSKIQALLDEMPVLETSQRFSVLDLGSGPGTGALAVLDWWHRSRTSSALSIVAVDNAPTALRQAKQLWDRYCGVAGVGGASLQTYEGDMERSAWLKQVQRRTPFDLIILANCLNEIYGDAKDPISARASLVNETLSLLAPNGTVMIVEPALRETSRALHQVRDRLVQAGVCNVYSPCLHEKNCPALMNPGDWCHEERTWQQPAVIQQIDEEVGFIKDALKFSYLLLRTDGRTIAERRPDVYRVVSELRVMKGDTRAWVCNEMGRTEVGRLDRAGSQANGAWDQCQRGTIVKIESVNRKELSTLGRIPIDGIVEIIRPA